MSSLLAIAGAEAWLICARDGGAEVVSGDEEDEEDEGVLGVENAPVEERCRRSNSSCSWGGRRGGEGPVAKEVLLWIGVLVVKRRPELRCVTVREARGRRRDILICGFV